LILSATAVAAHADTYDIGTSGLTGNFTPLTGLLTVSGPGTSTNGTVKDNGVSSPTMPEGNFNFQGTVTGAGQITITSFFDDSTPNTPTVQFPNFSLSSPLSTTFMHTSSETDIFFPASYGPGSELRLMGINVASATISNATVSADMDFTTPLPNPVWSAATLLGGLGMLRFGWLRRRQLA